MVLQDVSLARSTQTSKHMVAFSLQPTPVLYSNVHIERQGIHLFFAVVLDDQSINHFPFFPKVLPRSLGFLAFGFPSASLPTALAVPEPDPSSFLALNFCPCP